MSGEHHFGVIVQKLLLHGRRVTVQLFDHRGLVDLVMLNFRSFLIQVFLENKNSSLPVRAAYFGHLTIDELMFVLHKEPACNIRIQFTA